MVMKLAGKYLDFDEFLSPEFRQVVGRNYENITPEEARKLEIALRVYGTAPMGSEQSQQGSMLLKQIQTEIMAAKGQGR